MNEVHYHIVAHPSRLEQVAKLREKLPTAKVFLDRKGIGALANHLRAIKAASAEDGYVVIMEDDAQPVEGFTKYVDEWIERFPNDLISLYLGTGRPPQWQPIVDNKLSDLAPLPLEPQYISLPTLIHGVCYVLPTAMIDDMIELSLPTEGQAADYYVGAMWNTLTHREVLYPVESLVDHEDGESTETHPDGCDRVEIRKARRLMGNNDDFS